MCHATVNCFPPKDLFTTQSSYLLGSKFHSLINFSQSFPRTVKQLILYHTICLRVQHREHKLHSPQQHMENTCHGQFPTICPHFSIRSDIDEIIHVSLHECTWYIHHYDIAPGTSITTTLHLSHASTTAVRNTASVDTVGDVVPSFAI